jgi:hypothetical protein
VVPGSCPEVAFIYLKTHGLSIHDTVRVISAPGTGSRYPDARTARGDRPPYFFKLLSNGIEVLMVDIRDFY